MKYQNSASFGFNIFILLHNIFLYSSTTIYIHNQYLFSSLTSDLYISPISYHFSVYTFRLIHVYFLAPWDVHMYGFVLFCVASKNVKLFVPCCSCTVYNSPWARKNTVISAAAELYGLLHKQGICVHRFK